MLILGQSLTGLHHTLQILLDCISLHFVQILDLSSRPDLLGTLLDRNVNVTYMHICYETKWELTSPQASCGAC